MSRKTLLIEDDAHAKAVIGIFIRRLGWERPCLALTGREALRELRDNGDKFDVIIMDYGLSDMNGLEVFSKAQSLLINLPPVIMVTGNYETSIKTEAKKLGVSAFFMKSELHLMKALLKKMFR